MTEWTPYFEERILMDKSFPILKDKQKRCCECAANDLYGEVTEALKKEPWEIRLKIRQKWFCHMDPSTRCVGAGSITPQESEE